MNQTLLKTLSTVFPVSTGYAHCDLPCGIYDPHTALLGALTVIRMDDVISELVESGKQDGETRNNFVRAVKIKEEHAELVKREVRVIWGDYFKGEMKAKYTELDPLVHEIMELGSKAKQGVERKNAEALLEKVNRFAEIFWDSKAKETFRAKAPYKPESEVVYPKL